MKPECDYKLNDRKVQQDNRNEDLIKFWSNQTDWPVLSKAVLVLLAISVSSAKFEGAFVQLKYLS